MIRHKFVLVAGTESVSGHCLWTSWIPNSLLPLQFELEPEVGIEPTDAGLSTSFERISALVNHYSPLLETTCQNSVVSVLTREGLS